MVESYNDLNSEVISPRPRKVHHKMKSSVGDNRQRPQVAAPWSKRQIDDPDLVMGCEGKRYFEMSGLKAEQPHTALKTLKTAFLVWLRRQIVSFLFQSWRA